MTSDSYVSVYLMEYVWKTEQMSGEGNMSIAGNSTAEEKSLEEDIEEEQGEYTNLITGAKTSLFRIGMFREAAPPVCSCC